MISNLIIFVLSIYFSFFEIDIENTDSFLKLFPKKTVIKSPELKIKPNIVILLCDDLGYADVGFNYSPHVSTPSIDSLCHAGMKFTRCYSGSGVCSPSRASLLTGRYARELGIDYALLGDKNEYLPAVYETLPKALSRAGYTTAHIGKWHLGGIDSPMEFEARARGEKLSDGPLEHGFDHALVMMENNNMRMYLTKNGGIYNGGTRYLYQDNERVHPFNGHWESYKGDKAVDFINSVSSKQPFFLNVWFDAPHTPIEPAPEPFLSRYENIFGKGKIAEYCSMIAHLDWQVGRIVTALKENQLFENTIILFLSDNGATLSYLKGSNAPFRAGKWTGYQGGIVTPSFVCWPGHIKSNSVCSEPIHHMDFLPTLCDIVGVEMKDKEYIDGVSLKRLFINGDPIKERELYFTIGDSHVIIKNNFKVGLFNEKRGLPLRWEMYDLKSDMQEKINCMDQNIETFNQMKELLLKYIDRPQMPLKNFKIRDELFWKKWIQNADSIANISE